MKSEEALVILLGRLSFDSIIKTRIYHLIKKGVDWYEVLNICIRHKLICLVYKNLIELNLIQLLPMIVINNMHAHYIQNTYDNEKFLSESKHIIKYTKANNILATPVDGIHFIHTLYKNDPGVRIMSDIDYIASITVQDRIHNYMIDSGYKLYLINDEDAFCYFNKNIQKKFYIKTNNTSIYERLRVDFDFSLPDEWIRLIYQKEKPIYFFLYLCNSYYEKMNDKLNNNIYLEQKFTNLLEMYEYYKKYLNCYSYEQIISFANGWNLHKQVEFVLRVFDNYKNIFLY